jgi:hypothetical protein
MRSSTLQRHTVESIPVTFAEKFCSGHRISTADFEQEMLRRSLYPAGRLIRFLVGGNSNYFTPDREFIRAVGKLTRLHGFGAEVWAFTVNPENSRPHRLHLKMRVSTKKVYQQLVSVMRPNVPIVESGNSIPPM